MYVEQGVLNDILHYFRVLRVLCSLSVKLTPCEQTHAEALIDDFGTSRQDVSPALGYARLGKEPIGI